MQRPEIMPDNNVTAKTAKPYTPVHLTDINTTEEHERNGTKITGTAVEKKKA